MSPVGGWGWAVAGLMVGMSELYEGVKDGIREYCLRVFEVVVFSKFSVDVEFAKNNHLNDPQTTLPNAIFDTLKALQHYFTAPYFNFSLQISFSF